ncbi:MAG: flagellar protein [Lachnospiraceae bacterium]|nr:flagellar protein [Lachnospiraceae bacterium]
MRRIQENYTSIDQMRGKLLQNSSKTENSQSASDVSFQDIFQKKQEQAVENLKFSKHANARLTSRNINLSAEQMVRLEQGTTKAREKGIQESLVMVDDLAFIVNVKNNTVITAVNDMTDSIFTNIDGAVIN